VALVSPASTYTGIPVTEGANEPLSVSGNFLWNDGGDHALRGSNRVFTFWRPNPLVSDRDRLFRFRVPPCSVEQTMTDPASPDGLTRDDIAEMKEFCEIEGLGPRWLALCDLGQAGLEAREREVSNPHSVKELVERARNTADLCYKEGDKYTYEGLLLSDGVAGE
jgi:hypothetical protein